MCLKKLGKKGDLLTLVSNDNMCKYAKLVFNDNYNPYKGANLVFVIMMVTKGHNDLQVDESNTCNCSCTTWKSTFEALNTKECHTTLRI